MYKRDHENVYTPVINFTLWLRTMTIAFSHNSTVLHVDVKAAFLNADIDRDIFVTYSYNIPSNNLKGKVYKHSKSLYGLKQSPLLWFQKLRNVLVNILNYNQFRTD